MQMCSGEHTSGPSQKPQLSALPAHVGSASVPHSACIAAQADGMQQPVVTPGPPNPKLVPVVRPMS